MNLPMQRPSLLEELKNWQDTSGRVDIDNYDEFIGV